MNDNKNAPKGSLLKKSKSLSPKRKKDQKGDSKLKKYAGRTKVSLGKDGENASTNKRRKKQISRALTTQSLVNFSIPIKLNLDKVDQVDEKSGEMSPDDSSTKRKNMDVKRSSQKSSKTKIEE